MEFKKINILEKAIKTVENTNKQFNEGFKVRTIKEEENKKIVTTYKINSDELKKEFKNKYGLDLKSPKKENLAIQHEFKKKSISLLRKFARENLK